MFNLSLEFFYLLIPTAEFSQSFSHQTSWPQGHVVSCGTWMFCAKKNGVLEKLFIYVRGMTS